MAKIIDFKTRATKFRDWIGEVIRSNFRKESRSLSKVHSAVLLWDEQDEKTKEFTCFCAHFNCDTSDMNWFSSHLGRRARQREFSDFLREHISEYIEYI